MKYIRKFDDKDEITNISESFAEGLSISCGFFIHAYENYKRYDIYFNLKSALDASEFDQKRKSFEKRINSIGYEIVYKTESGRIVSQSETFITFSRKINSVLAMLNKSSS